MVKKMKYPDSKMIVGIIAFNNIKYCPYIKPYTHILDEMNIKYNIIYFDRDGVDEKDDVLIPVSWNKEKSKIYNFLIFSQIVKRIIKNINYDKLIVLTTVPGILLFPVLLGKYIHNYLIDIRDYTFEKYFLFRFLEKLLIKNAKVRVISAPGFRKFLPDSNYVMCHNTTYDFSIKNKLVKSDNLIVIGYIGSISYANQCKVLIDLVKNDTRFCFYFYGNDVTGNTITNMISEANCDRIKYFGAYEPKDKDKLIQSVDILFNAYGNNEDKLIYAISNKFYDSIFYKKPMITSPNTDMSLLLDVFSYDIDSNTKSLDEVYAWYQGINDEKMDDLTEKWSERITTEQSSFVNAIKNDFLK